MLERVNISAFTRRTMGKDETLIIFIEHYVYANFLL